MSYSKDIRRLVLTYVNGGGSKAEASRLYGVSRSRIYVWLKSGGAASGKKPGPKGSYRLDEQKLRVELDKRPDIMAKELAVILHVRANTIHYALKRLGISRKKNAAL